MSKIIAGGGGFIGLNFIKQILKTEKDIVILDNFSNSKLSTIESFLNDDNVKVIECDLSNNLETKLSIKKAINLTFSPPELWHFAANSDIPSGVNNSSIDLKDTFLTTFNLIEICKIENIKSFYFASSSAVYGDHGLKPLNEETGPMMPISNYGAMKLASEAICFAAKESHFDDLRIFRFPNVVGAPATHGVVLDFIRKLKNNPKKLKVLGNGLQEKSYLHVNDLVRGMIHLSHKDFKKVKNPIFNLGPSDSVSVKWIAEETIKIFSPDSEICYELKDRGWVGDIPKFIYNTEKVLKTGWEPLLNSKEAIKLAIKEIISQET